MVGGIMRVVDIDRKKRVEYYRQKGWQGVSLLAFKVILNKR